MDKIHVDKPWGCFDQYTLNEISTVKILTVKPGEILSLQSHEHREELWVALDNGLKVDVNDGSFTTETMKEYFIPKKAKHRLSNPSAEVGRVMEISFGKFDEEDITRYEDKYSRT